MSRPFRTMLLALPLSVVVGILAWISGPPEFDFLDGTEFAVCTGGLNVPHPPGYPLFMFLLKSASAVLPLRTLDYGSLRLVTSVTAAAGMAVGASALATLGAGTIAALTGSFLFFTLGGVMDQMNLLEVHALSILLVLLAIRLRASRAGPYMFSLAVFGGHPVSVLLAPLLMSRRLLSRWAVLTVIPASLWLFVPIRSTYQALCHYSRPETLVIFRQYLTLYGGKFTSISLRAAEAMISSVGLLSLGVILLFILLSGKIMWRMLAASSAGFLFLSFYYMGDTNSLLWVPLLPLCIWASRGIGKLVSRGRAAALLAAVLVAVSAVSGTVRAWRGEDESASLLVRDLTRGVGLEGVYITIGFLTFNTAYILDVMDLRPDILPMDEYECYFRIPPPPFYPAEIAGRRVYANRAWTEEALAPVGLLFSVPEGEVDWSIYDSFGISGNVHDRYTRNEICDIWLKRMTQTPDVGERGYCIQQALIWGSSVDVEKRISWLERHEPAR